LDLLRKGLSEVGATRRLTNFFYRRGAGLGSLAADLASAMGLF